MNTYYVKLNGTDTWFEVQAESSVELANRLKAEGKSGVIRAKQQKEGPPMKNNQKTNTPITTGGNPMEPKTNKAPDSIRKHVVLSPEVQQWLRNILERDIAPILETDVSSYARGRQRIWMPYQAPLDTAANITQPFEPKLMHAELWQWIVNICDQYGIKAQTALISKGGSIKPHRDTTYAAEWAFGINLGECKWSIASDRDSSKTDYTMLLKGGEVFSFNSKHVHSVSDVSPDRWAINVWAIADTRAARNARIQDRIDEMLANNPQLDEFIKRHQPNIKTTTKTGGNTMKPQETDKKEVGTMFHGMVRIGDSDLIRVATNVPLMNKDTVDERFDNGVYSFALLDTFFPQGYRLEVRRVMVMKGGKEGPINTYNSVTDNRVAIRWSNASYQFNLMIKGNNGWLDSLEKAGFIIGNSKKFIKRAQEFARQTSAFMRTDELNIEIINPVDIGLDEKAVDGISAISRSMAMQMFLNNTNASIDWTQDKVKQIEQGKMVIVSLRVITPHGLIKGNAIIVPDKQMNGFDIRTFTPNVKAELKTNGFYWATIEPSYGRLPLKSDDLTMSIYKNVVGLVDPALLLATMQSAVTKMIADIKADKIDQDNWVQTVIDNTGMTEHLDDDIKGRPSMIKSIDQLSKRLAKAGLNINVSQLLMYFKANGIGRMFGVIDKNNKVVPAGEVYGATDNGTWFPVPYAYRAHIMTRDALEVFGYKLPKDNGQGFYHHKTHCFVVPTKFFIDNYINHGGYDLDDTVNVMIRRFINNNGKVKLKAFLLRNPNDFGEWSMIPVSDEEVGNAFHTYDQIPTVKENQLRAKVRQLSYLVKNRKIRYQFSELPGVSSLTIGDQFSPDDERRVRLSIEQLPGGTGATVLPKMLTYAITDTYLENQLVSNEQIIDAVQQGLADVNDMMLISESNEQYYEDISDWLYDNDGKIDYYWAMTRMNEQTIRLYNYADYISEREDSMMMELMLTRETIVRTAYAELLDWANNDLIMPEAIANMVFSQEELKATPGEFNTIIELMRNTNPSKLWAGNLVKMLAKSDEMYGQEVTDRKVLRLYRQGFIAKKANPRANWDKWLFVVDPSINQLPIDWFIRAYTRLVANS